MNVVINNKLYQQAYLFAQQRGMNLNDIIITRNGRDFSGSKIPIMTAGEFLLQF